MTDLISRKDAIKELNEDVKWLEEEGHYGVSFDEMRNRVLELLNKLPSAQPKPKKGKWEYVDCLVGEIRFPFPMCSVCKKTSSPFIEPKFCPNCGADMRKDGE